MLAIAFLIVAVVDLALLIWAFRLNRQYPSVALALLTAPHFIYKSESAVLTDVERAYRLSYFLWNSVPDAELLDAARSGALVKDPSAQVERMLDDARAGRFVAEQIGVQYDP